MPLLAAWMHIRPWETDDLTFADLRVLAEAIEARIRGGDAGG